MTLPNNVTFIDTPGLADYEIRSEVAKNITEALQEGGNFKFLFVATTLNGRFKAEDVTTIKLVLDAVPQIDVDEYGIIVNQLEAAEFEGLKKPENQKKFFMPLWAGLQKITSHIELLEKDPELSGCENSVKEFPNMQQFVSSLPTVRIDPSAVKDVESREFSQIREEYENLVNDEEKMLEELRKKEEQIRRLETVPTWLKGILTVLSTMALVGAMVVLWCGRTIHDTPVWYAAVMSILLKLQFNTKLQSKTTMSLWKKGKIACWLGTVSANHWSEGILEKMDF